MKRIHGLALCCIALFSVAACSGANTESQGQTREALDSASGLHFSSTGDPHEVTGDGFAFENQKKGTFTALKSYSAIVKDGSPQELMVMKYQEPCNVGVTCNTRAAVYAGGTKLKFFADGTVILNGVATSLASNTLIALRKPDGKLSGATLVRTDAPGRMVLTIRSPAGDIIVLDDYLGSAMNISGSISTARAGERVRGSLGCFDGDDVPSNDLCKRFARSLEEIVVNGAETFYPLTNEGVDSFLEAWRSVQADCAMADLGVDLKGHCSW